MIKKLRQSAHKMRKIKSHTCLKVLFNFAFFFEIPDLPFVLKKETSSTLVPIVHFLFSDKMENHPLSKSIISDLVMGDKEKKKWICIGGRSKVLFKLAVK